MPESNRTANIYSYYGQSLTRQIMDLLNVIGHCPVMTVLLFHAGPSQQPERRHRRSATYVSLLVGGRACCHACQSARALSSSLSNV
jgi:hypothetical protein